MGKYLLSRSVGKGGFASVYYATHVDTGSAAAVKLLHRELIDRSDVQQRFAREAQVLLELDSPYIVKLYDFGVLEDADMGVYMTMEWCEGQTLHEAIASQPHRRFSASQVRNLCLQLLWGLDHIHAQGVVHRDLKPNNLMLIETPQGPQFKILDFGLAWVAGEALTRSGVVIGSLLFMSPEQIRGHKELYGPATDLYAVGLILAWMLTGKHVFGDAGAENLAVQHVLEKPPSLSQLCPEIRWSGSLEAVVAKALAKAPDQRFGSALEFADALQSADFPDFSRAFTLPTADAPMRRYQLAAFDDTGSYSLEFKQTDVKASPFEKRTVPDGIPFGEREGISRPRRRRGPWLPLALLVLAGLVGLGWWLEPFAPSAPAGVGKQKQPARRAPASATPAPGLRVAPDGRALPAGIPTWVSELVFRWREAWQALSQKPYRPESRALYLEFYHPKFLDKRSQKDRVGYVDAQVSDAQNSSWMRIELKDLRLQSLEPDASFSVLFHQKCISSTFRAGGKSSGIVGGTHLSQGFKTLHWRKVGKAWKIWRIQWTPTASGP